MGNVVLFIGAKGVCVGGEGGCTYAFLDFGLAIKLFVVGLCI